MGNRIGDLWGKLVQVPLQKPEQRRHKWLRKEHRFSGGGLKLRLAGKKDIKMIAGAVAFFQNSKTQ